MALHAATVEILVEKAKFEPTVALGVAEAIELAMTQGQFITVPILDARLHVLEAKLDASIQANKADMQRLSAELDAKMDTRFAKMENKSRADGGEARALGLPGHVGKRGSESGRHHGVECAHYLVPRFASLIPLTGSSGARCLAGLSSANR